MEAMIRDDVSGKRVRHEVAETATAAELLQEACTLFGREVLDFALEVDGVVVCTSASGGEASVGSLGVHSDSRLVLCRSRDRVLAMMAEWSGWDPIQRDSLPLWAWDDEAVALAVADLETAPELEFVSERLRSSRSFMLDAVTRNMHALKYASVELRSDKAFVLAAVASKGYSLQYASESLRADREVVMTAVANRSGSLQYASDSLKADREVVMAAVTKYGYSLEFASDNLKADREVALTAVASTGYSLQYASDSLRADREVVMAAVANDSASMQYASAELQADLRSAGELVVAAVADGKRMTHCCRLHHSQQRSITAFFAPSGPDPHDAAKRRRVGDESYS